MDKSELDRSAAEAWEQAKASAHEERDTQIGEMEIDGLSIDQLEVILRLTLNAEEGYGIAGRTALANQCMVLRNRVRDRRKDIQEGRAHPIQRVHFIEEGGAA